MKEMKTKVTTEEMIRIQLLRNGVTMADVARDIGVGTTSVTRFVRGISRSQRIARGLVAAGVPEDIVEAHVCHGFVSKRRAPVACGSA